MNIEKLIDRKKAKNNPKLMKAYNKLYCLLEVLKTKEIPSEVLNNINEISKYMTKNEIYQYCYDFQSLTRHSLQRLAHI